MKKAMFLLLAVMLVPFVSCKKTAFFAFENTALILSADRTILKANGDKAQITVIGITEEGEAVHDHTVVMFTATLGKIQATAEFMDGRATVEFVSGKLKGTAEITARSGKNVSDALEIAIGSGALSRLTLSASPTLLGPGGGYAQITAYAFDADMNALADVPVILTTTCGDLSGGSAVRLTDSKGLVSDSLYTEAKATVAADSGSAHETVTVNVRENTLPVSGFSISPASVVVGQTAYFDGSLSTDDDGEVVKWEWNFGDGNTDWGRTTSHAYAAAGTYSITLKVTDNNGGCHSIMKPLTITE